MAAVKTMTDQRDIYRSAKLLIDQHGAVEAEIHAAQRAHALLETGVLDGRRVWLRVLDAVRGLSDTTPTGVIH